MSTANTGQMTPSGAERRRFMVLGGAALGVLAVSRLLPRPGVRRSAGGTRWYEVVQDMYHPNKWHVNLYAAATLGDVRTGTLEKRWTETAASFAQVKKDLDFPWRVQYSDGPQEQDF